MSTLPNPVPVPRPVPAPEAPRRGGRFYLLGLLILASVGAAGWYALQRPESPTTGGGAPVSVKTAAAVLGDMEVRVRINGSTNARNYANISAPKVRSGFGGELTILSMASSGQFVKQGDVIAEIDPVRLKESIDDEQDRLRNSTNDLKKKQMDQELDMENLNQSLRVAKAALDKAKLDQKTTEVRTTVDRELLRLSVDEAQAAYDETLKEIEQRKISQKADYRSQEISFQIQKRRVDFAQQDLEKYTLRAPMNGMVVVQSQNRPGGDQVMVAAGDRIIPGQTFMKIVDTRSMQIEATINQAESSSFKVGQEAVITLDAFPGAVYQGKVFSIGALASAPGRSASYFLRNVPVRVQFLDPDSKVIPDLSAAADVLMSKVTMAVQVPAQAVERSGSQSFVNVKTAKGFEKRPVKTGVSNGAMLQIVEGLKPGEEVRLPE